MNGLASSAIALSVLAGMLAACTTAEQAARSSLPHEGVPARQQLNFQLASGVYGCEQGQKVEIQRDARNASRIDLNWQGKSHTLQRYESSSGLPRYEDRENGLLWIDLPWKGVLMDTGSGRPLANECKVKRS